MSAVNKNYVVSNPKLPHLPHPGGLGCILFEKMTENRDRIAQIDAATGGEETYSLLLKRSIRGAIAMKSQGIRYGDIVTVCSSTHVDVCVPYLSAIFIGAIPTTVDPSLSLNDVKHLLQQITPKMIFIEEETRTLITSALEELSQKSKLITFGTKFDSFLKATKEEDSFKPVQAKSLQSTALILFSSGTSGLPKGICLSHLGIIFQASATTIPYARSLTFATFYWISTFITLISTAFTGSLRIVVPKFDPHAFWYIQETYRPTMMFIAPSYIMDVIKLPRPSETPSLQVAIISGSAVSETCIRAFQDIFSESYLMLGYAQTETAGMVSIFDPRNPDERDWMRTKPLSSGRILPGFSVRIVDPDTDQTLRPNRRGEIRIKSDVLFTGYYKLDSSSTFDHNGWYKTGDIGYFDDDLCLFVVDRIKEVLKYRAFQVPPAAVEAVILEHPSVERAVVLGIPHDDDGEHPLALVVLMVGAERVTAEQIREFVDERVNEHQKLRGGVKIVDYIPLTCTGKVKRHDLKSRILRGEL